MVKHDKSMYQNNSHGGNAVYFFGFIGALVFYVQSVDGFWNIILGILKAFVWPAFVVHDLLKFLV